MVTNDGKQVMLFRHEGRLPQLSTGQTSLTQITTQTQAPTPGGGGQGGEGSALLCGMLLQQDVVFCIDCWRARGAVWRGQ